MRSQRLRVSWAFKASREADDLDHSLDGGAVNPWLLANELEPALEEVALR